MAVHRDGTVQLSPGPQTLLSCGDTLMVACELSQVDQVAQLLGHSDEPEPEAL